MSAGELLVSADLVTDAAEWVERALASSLARAERVTLALSGGSSPAPVYAALARRALVEWSRVDLYFADERCVAPDHPDSNYRLVEQSFLENLSVRPPVVHRMEGEDPDRDAAARRYAEILPASFDLVLLGMGPDGHTASLFPGHPAVLERERTVVHVGDSPKPPPDRLTLTPPVLAAARRTVVLAPGASKAATLRAVLEGPWDPARLPAQLVRDGAWIVDPEAASELTEGADV